MARMRSAAVLLLVLLTGCTASTPDPTGSPPASADPTSVGPAVSSPPAESGPSPSESPSSAASTTGLDTAEWHTYTSARYGFDIGHPPDWTVVPSERDWTLEQDAGVVDSPGQEGFMGASGDIWVTVWAADYEGEATLTAVQTWAEQYCVESNANDCATLGDRAVRLCNGQQECHPGLLVPFTEDVQAFFTGGPYGERIIGVASWRPPAYRVVESGLAGTSREILDAFLSTMDVWPQP